MEHLQAVPIIVAVVVHFVFGMLWYSPILCGKAWMKLVGMTEKDMEKAKGGKMATSMLMGLISSVVVASVLMYMMGEMSISEPRDAAMLGLVAWFGFLATSQLGRVLWENSPCKLYIINTSYWLISLVGMSVIISLF